MGSGQDDGSRRAGLGTFLFDEIRRAFQDIRQRVVEEGWFGRITTPLPREAHPPGGLTAPAEAKSEPELTLNDLWSSPAGPERSPPADHERGIDL